MSFDNVLVSALVVRCSEVVDAHTQELTDLDRAIGDADHGLNMQRGFAAVRQQQERLATLDLASATSELGKILVMKVGGASGPLFGTFFMRFGQELPQRAGLPSLAEARAALDAAIAGVMARGKAQPGQKTLLDVLVPLQVELRRPDGTSWAAVRAVVASAAQATIPLRAERGRASFLGERSVGHMDPGARSLSLLITAVCDVLEHHPELRALP